MEKFEREPSPSLNPPSLPVDPIFATVCSSMISRLINYPACAPFIFPVDEVQAPLYYSMIRKPVDLSTIQRRIDNGIYLNDFEALCADVRLIVFNCFKYNQDNSPVAKQAKKFEIYFDHEVYFESRLELAVSKARGFANEDEEMELEVISTEIAAQCLKIFRKIEHHKQSFWFKQPVFNINLG